MSRVVVIEPPEPIVSWAEAQRHLRLDGDDERTIVEAMIAAAQGNIDGPQGWLGRAIGPQVLEVAFDRFPCDRRRLPLPPVLELVGVRFEDSGAWFDLPDGVAEVRGEELGTAWGKSWPSPLTHGPRSETVRIRYRAGYAKPKTGGGFDPAIPAPIKAAVLLMVGDLFQHRETVATGGPQAIPMSITVEALLSPFRVWS